MKANRVFLLLGLTFLILACSKEDEKLILDTTSTSLYSLETTTITSNGTNVTFTSRDPYVAGVDESGVVTARFVGETIIDVVASEGSAEFKVSVIPKYNTFTEPCHDWTKKSNEVFSIYSNLSFSQSGDYWGATVDKSKGIVYMFKFGDNDRLEATSMSISQSYAIEAVYFLSERYLPLDSQDGYYIWVDGLSTESITTYIAMTKISGYKAYMIMYLPYSSVKSSSPLLFPIDLPTNNLPEEWKE